MDIPNVMAQTASSTDTSPSKHFEIIHHPNYDKSVFMPFSPAIKINSGKILWLAGGTALPVYHDHPHKRDELQKYMVNDLEAQVRQAMDGIKQTVEEAGGSMKNVRTFIYLSCQTKNG
jgi:enamine deaminase RidA (YjgF/YER057c/UK114 family)